MATRLDPTHDLTEGERAPVGTGRRVLAGVEVALAVAAVLADLVVPSLVLLAMAVVSLAARRQGWSALGFHRPSDRRLPLKMLVFAAVWSLFQLGVTMPIANHLSGERTDLSAFEDVEGDLGALLAILLLSWTVAALVEELAYRGYLQTRIRELVGPAAGGTVGVVVAVLASSVLFGIAHSEQALVGVVTITLDAVVYSVLRYRFGTLWAPVLAHGFNNTIGFVAFFFVGPVYGLW